ncbi:SRPBCC domain-containing protein [Horticoccus sp. 23ND18S-11]|uniref:SRPBCC domain-containing protein n=1 Tax=Horticoccus sp. 23ND18S-11 TaxID=3391832 RepID=UPI0039C9B7D0
MKYICLGYYNATAFAALPEAEQVAMMDNCFGYDEYLRANGHFTGGEALQPAVTAMTLRVTNGQVVVTDGPFAETKEQIGGILILEARDLNHAVDLISKHPGVKIGPWEIRPAADLSEIVRQSAARRRVASTFHTTRELPVSPAQVFAAIQDPSRLARWWGPNGFTNTFEQFEFKPDGKWVFTMNGPDGRQYRNESVFGPIVRDRQVVIHHVSAPKFVLTISLERTAAGTLVIWDHVFDDPAVAEAVRPIVEPGNEQNLDRLAALVRA